jgi:hypothetical protein
MCKFTESFFCDSEEKNPPFQGEKTVIHGGIACIEPCYPCDNEGGVTIGDCFRHGASTGHGAGGRVHSTLSTICSETLDETRKSGGSTVPERMATTDHQH